MQLVRSILFLVCLETRYTKFYLIETFKSEEENKRTLKSYENKNIENFQRVNKFNDIPPLETFESEAREYGQDLSSTVHDNPWSALLIDLVNFTKKLCKKYPKGEIIIVL